MTVDGNDLPSRDRRPRGRRRARPRRRGADAARLEDVPHARPRGGFRHRVRSAAPDRRCGRRKTPSPASIAAARRRHALSGEERDDIRAAFKAHIDHDADLAYDRRSRTRRPRGTAIAEWALQPSAGGREPRRTTSTADLFAPAKHDAIPPPAADAPSGDALHRRRTAETALYRCIARRLDAIPRGPC